MKKISILGAGISGRSAAGLAEKQGLTPVIYTDDTFPEKAEWGELCVVSPGVPPVSPMYRAAAASGIPMISEMAFGARYFPGKMLAITGTDGKTTTTELTVALLRAAGLAVCTYGIMSMGRFAPYTPDQSDSNPASARSVMGCAISLS